MDHQHQKTHGILPIWMLILGTLATYIGINRVREWEHISSALQVYLAVSLLAGVALITGGALSLWVRPLKHWAFLTGVVAALALGTNHAIALWFNIIPCDSPG